MNKEEYRRALKSPKWIAKREKIKKRDGFKCVKCNCKNNLHVHHTYYLPNKMPWEVPDDCLITLCKVCHTKEHEGKNISSFARKSAPKKTPVVKKSAPKKKRGSRKARREGSKIKQNIPKVKTPPKPKLDKIKILESYLYIAIKSERVKIVLSQNDDWKKAVKDNKHALVEGFYDEDLALIWLNAKNN